MLKQFLLQRDPRVEFFSYKRHRETVARISKDLSQISKKTNRCARSFFRSLCKFGASDENRAPASGWLARHTTPHLEYFRFQGTRTKTRAFQSRFFDLSSLSPSVLDVVWYFSVAFVSTNSTAIEMFNKSSRKIDESNEQPIVETKLENEGRWRLGLG